MESKHSYFISKVRNELEATEETKENVVNNILKQMQN